MDKIAVKIFASGPAPELREFVPIFHRWIQTHAVEDHLLIDVADYAHVSGGPGVVLVATEANFYFDQTENRPGLLYTRKTPLMGSMEERLTVATRACLKAAIQMERDPALAGRLHFAVGELLIRLDDRLLAPNTDETFEMVKPAVEALAGKIFGASAFTIERHPVNAKLFAVTIKSSSAQSLGELLDRLQTP